MSRKWNSMTVTTPRLRGLAWRPTWAARNMDAVSRRAAYGFTIAVSEVLPVITVGIRLGDGDDGRWVLHHREDIDGIFHRETILRNTNRLEGFWKMDVVPEYCF